MMHSTSAENWKDFWTYLGLFVGCTAAIELFYIAIFIIRYKQTKPTIRRRSRRGDYELDELSIGQSVEDNSYPDYWEPFNNGEGFKLVLLYISSNEYKFVQDLFEKTLTRANFKIEQIHRIQNELLWTRYYDCTKRMNKNNNGNTNEKYLWHGTRTVNPKDIYQGDSGFDMRFSAEGMWGKGNYFAVKACYSDSYSHECSNKSRQLLLASVLTGYEHKCTSDRTLTKPPIRDSTGEISRRYDSVTGETGNSQVYITYENDRAYPSYLVTYRKL